MTDALDISPDLARQKARELGAAAGILHRVPLQIVLDYIDQEEQRAAWDANAKALVEGEEG